MRGATNARLLSGETLLAGVVGRPVRHSLSPRIHSAWIAAAGIDGAYAPFPIPETGFRRFVEGMRGGVIRGVNVTIPYKEEALALADAADALARRSGAANLLLFHADGEVEARNTDGPGLIQALAEAPGFDPAAAPAVVMDMVYKPLETGLLRQARASGRPTVDGLSMLINQAAPAFEAFYGAPVPPGVDVRALCLEVLEPGG